MTPGETSADAGVKVIAIPVTVINEPLQLGEEGAAEGDMPAQHCVISGAPSETLLSALRRAPIDASASPSWSAILSGGLDSSVWFSAAGFDPGALVIGQCVIRPDATLADVVEYFGDDVQDDAFGIRVYPIEGIGDDSGPEWIEIARDGIDELSALSPWQILRFNVGYFGFIRGVRVVPAVLGTVVARGVRRDAIRWRESRDASAALTRYMRRRRRWDTARVGQRLGIDHRSAGALLQLAGFSLSVEDYRTWRRDAA